MSDVGRAMSEEPDVSSLPDRREREAQGNPCVQVQWQRLGVRAAISSFHPRRCEAARLYPLSVPIKSMPPSETYSRRQRHARLGRESNDIKPGPQQALVCFFEDAAITNRSLSQPCDEDGTSGLRLRPLTSCSNPRETTEVRRDR